MAVVSRTPSLQMIDLETGEWKKIKSQKIKTAHQSPVLQTHKLPALQRKSSQFHGVHSPLLLMLVLQYLGSFAGLGLRHNGYLRQHSRTWKWSSLKCCMRCEPMHVFTDNRSHAGGGR